MSRPVLPHEVDALLARTSRWLHRAVGLSVHLANHGPPWIPKKVRRAPLRVCSALMWLMVRGWL